MMKMNKLKIFRYLIYLLTIGIIISTGCSKDDTTDTDLEGNWKVSYEFEGVGRTDAVSFTIGEEVYVGLGYNGSLGSNSADRLTDFWAFQKSNGTWKKVANFPGKARNAAVAFVIDGIAYVGTGYDGTTRLNDFWAYHPATNSWHQIADFGGSARYGAVAFAIGGTGYVATGNDGNYLKDLWAYNPTSNSWTQKASLAGSKRQDAVAFVHNEKAYIVTGTNNASLLTDFYYYDPATDAWTRLRNINSSNDDEDYDDDYGSGITRSNAAVFVLNNKAYLCCGTISGNTGTVWEYNIDTDLWAQKTSFEGSARQGAIGFDAGNYGFITTGTSGSSYFDDLWQFDPNAEQSSTDNY
ncbi:Kelch repeat-containing protein [Niabella terrae]